MTIEIGNEVGFGELFCACKIMALKAAHSIYMN